MTYIYANVQPMANAISRLQTFHGDETDTRILVAKAVLQGAHTYESASSHLAYIPGSVKALRAEAVLIQQQLHRSIILSKEQSARSVGKEILPLEKIIDLQAQKPKKKSEVLDLVLTYIGDDTQKQRTQLAELGKRISSRIVPSTHYMTPDTVDISKLKTHRPTPGEKVVYQELKRIKKIIETL